MAETLTVVRPTARKSRVLLPGQSVAGGRYSVAKPLGLSRQWARYLLRRRDDGSFWRLDVVEGSDDALAHALERLSRWAQPGLVRVVEHFREEDRHFVITAGIEGHNLEAALRWTSEPLDRDRLLDWAASLCRTLQSLYEGGLLAAAVGLAPTGVVVTPDHRLVVRDLEFPALLGGGPRDGRLAGAMQSFADLLSLLGSPKDLPPDLIWVVARCRSGDPERAYRSFREVEETLEALRRPEEAPQAAPLAPAVAPSNYRAPDLPQTPWEALVSLSPARKAALGLVLGACALAAAAWTWPTMPVRTGPAVWFTSGRSLYAVDSASARTLGHLDVDDRLGATVASVDGRRLFAAEPEGSELTVVDTVEGEVLGHLRLSPGATEMRLDPTGRRLFVLHPVAGRLMVVGLEAAGPGSVGGARVEGVLATAPDPVTFTVLAADPERGIPARAAVSAADGSLTLYGLDPPATLATSTPGELDFLTASRDGRTLYGVSHGAVLVFDGGTLESRGSFRDTGGEEPLQAFLSRDGLELWVIHRDGVLGVLNVADRSLRSALRVGGPARFAVPGPAEGPATLWVALVNGEVAVVDPARRSVKATTPVAPHMLGGTALPAPQRPLTRS